MSSPIMTFCKSSIQHFRTILARSGNHSAIGVYVKGGGCNGLQYKIEPLQERYPKDEHIHIDGVDISVCPNSLLFLIGTHVEWEETDMSKGLVFTNPNAKGHCGCGTTFNT